MYQPAPTEVQLNPRRERRNSVRKMVLLVAFFALVASACSNGGSVEVAQTTTEQASEPVTDTTLATDSDDGSTTTTEAPVPGGPVAPLTGVPVSASNDLDRPALVVKIDNHPNARPQTGLDQADIVFEMRAEGVTRFAAAFHSMAPAPLGPVRSSRTSDFDILRGLDEPLYASSGGNDYVANGLRSLPIQAVTAISRTEYFRDSSRAAPHNLYVNAEDLFALAESDTPPTAWFEYRSGSESLSSTAEEIAGAVTIAYKGNSPIVTHTWDEDRQGWLRTQDGRPHTTSGGDQLAPENIVIMETIYTVSPADPISPEVETVGSGRLYVLTDGHVITGTWSREAADAKPVLLDSDGEVIKLTPGRTWVLLPDGGSTTLPDA